MFFRARFDLDRTELLKIIQMHQIHHVNHSNALKHKNIEILKKFGLREPMFNSVRFGSVQFSLVRFGSVSEKSSRVSLFPNKTNSFRCCRFR